MDLNDIWDAIVNIDLSRLPRFDFWTMRGQINIGLPRIVPFSIIAWIALLYLFSLWLLLVWWVRQDIQRRTKDQRLIQIATVLVLLFNFPGLLLYFLWRPPTFKEIEQARMEEELMRLELEQLREWKKGKR